MADTPNCEQGQCPRKRVAALKKANRQRSRELEAALDQTDYISSQLENIDIKAASRKAAKRSAK